MTAVPSTVTASPRLALWVIVFAGSALRTSLLGCVLVAEAAIGETFGLSAGALAVLVESIVFGGLVAVFMVPWLVAKVGIRAASQGAAAGTVICLVAALMLAPLTSPAVQAQAGLFVVAALLGFFVAVLSPIAQTLLNDATTSDPSLNRSLQSVWSAGQPTGFVLASLLGGILLERFGWWSALVTPLAFAGIALLALMDRQVLQRAEQHETEVQPGIRDVAWIIVMLLAFQVWSTWGSLGSWLEPGVLVTLLATVIVSVVALDQLRRSQNPAISPQPFAIPGFAAAALILFVYQLPTTAEFEVLLLTQLANMPAAEIGTRTAIGNGGQIAGTALAAVLLLRHRIALALVAGFGLTLVGLVGYTLYPWWNDFPYTVVTRTIVGFGGGLLTPTLFVLALHQMPSSLQIAAGTWLVLAMIGGTEIGLALFDIVLEIAARFSGAKFAGFLAVEVAQLAVGAAVALLAALLTLRGTLLVRASSEPLSNGPA